ncbi:unnamed protein product [Leuciscus chuanchicus]
MAFFTFSEAFFRRLIPTSAVELGEKMAFFTLSGDTCLWLEPNDFKGVSSTVALPLRSGYFLGGCFVPVAPARLGIPPLLLLTRPSSRPPPHAVQGLDVPDSWYSGRVPSGVVLPDVNSSSGDLGVLFFRGCFP